MVKKRLQVLVLVLLAAVFSGVVFGFSHKQGWADASQYSAYAKNIVLGNGYTQNGTEFDASREPGFSLLLAGIYRIFGIENFTAVKIIEIILLGLIGWLIFLVFEIYEKPKAGIIAGVIIALIPNYGFYAGEILSEIPFAFFLALSFYLTVSIWTNKNAKMWQYSLFGLVSGYAALIRMQMIFFAPLMFLAVFIWSHRLGLSRKKIVSGLIVFFIVISSWVGYVYSKTGQINLGQGDRADSNLYVRTQRTKLGYAGQARYLYNWLKRSANAGEEIDFLNQNEWHAYRKVFVKDFKSAEQLQSLRQTEITYIEHHFGQYLFGDVVEFVKTGWIEHTYNGYINRYLRAGAYLLLYTGFLYGLWKLFRGRLGELRFMVWLALSFILYNYAVVSSFDSIPRYNTPYLFFYVVVAVAGISTIPVVKKYIQ